MRKQFNLKITSNNQSCHRNISNFYSNNKKLSHIISTIELAEKNSIIESSQDYCSLNLSEK